MLKLGERGSEMWRIVSMWALVEGLLEQDSFKGNSQVMNSFNCIRNYFNLSLKIRILDFIYPPASMTRSSNKEQMLVWRQKR